MSTPVVPPRPMFSIVTVCFNGLDVLPATLASLRAQQDADYEWVVVDGASTDGSAAWCAAQRPDAFVSEPDRGIYDAMNKAVRLARGEYLYFLNAGDRLADAHVLRDIALAAAAAPANADIVYGDVVYFGDRGERRRRFHWLTRGRLVYGDLCHQAAFARRALFERHGDFDTALRWNADFDWFLRVFDAGATLRYVPRVVAWFHDAGAHVQARARSEAERDAVRARRVSRLRFRLGNGLLRVELKLRRLLGQEI